MTIFQYGLLLLLVYSFYLPFVTSSGGNHVQHRRRNEKEHEIHHRIAYVFAGSPRSFTEYFVHESIRMNLIHSFCPPSTCESSIFARVSLDDNVHQAEGGSAIKDSGGRNVAGDVRLKPKVVEALHRLAKLPHPYHERFHVISHTGISSSSSSGSGTGSDSNSNITTSTSAATMPEDRVFISWGSVGSATEREEMSKEFNTLNHNVFRVMDARRYSMYFNRQKSYQQVLTYEREHNMTFSWVVHVRFDSVWGEPVQPVHFWETLDHTVNHRYDRFPKTADHLRHTGLHGLHTGWVEARDQMPKAKQFRIWTPDTWWSDVPDTFALLPRQYSDIFFSLDGLVAEGAMCLGGPNFLPESATPEALTKLNFTALEKSFVKTHLCLREDDGFSERILKRKLSLAGINLDKGNLGYQSFFMVIVRPDSLLKDMCFYLEEGRLIGWVYANQYANNAVSSACVRFMELQRVQRRDVHTEYATPVPVSLHTNTENVGFSSFCAHDGQEEFTGMNCLLDRSQTDWNFMPFRLHKHHLCMTSERNDGGKVLQRSCVTNVTMSSPPMNSTYSRLQLFHFLPLLKSTQQIKLMEGYQHTCLTVGDPIPIPLTDNSPNNDISSTSKKRREALVESRLKPQPQQQRRVSLSPCYSTFKKDHGLSQQFLVRVLHSTTADHLSAAEHRQFIVSAKNIPHALVPAVTVVSIAYIGDLADRSLLEDWHPHSHKHGQGHRRTTSASDTTATSNGSLLCLAIYSRQEDPVVMEPCDSQSTNQKIVLERSSTVAWVKYIRKRLEHQHYFPKNITNVI